MSSDTITSPTVTVRPVADGEWEAWNRVDAHAFGAEESPEFREFWELIREDPRCLGAYDGADPVGATAAFSFSMTVPGGAEVPVAGVSAVGVLPTHRRRGVLRALMRRQLDDLHENGEFLAALTASEPEIYGRFGYGLATWRMSLHLDRARVRLPATPEVAGRLRLRLAEPEAALDDCRKILDELVHTRPGLIARTGGWERLQILDPPSEREGASPLRCVVAEVDGQVRGYAYYATVQGFDAAGPVGTTLVREVVAHDPAVRLALWRFVLDLDLMASIKAGNLPLDDPLLHQLADPRAARPTFRDALFMRLVDVGQALSARKFATDVDLVLDVDDPFCPWNTGRWRLAGGPGGARCERTSDPADVRLGVRELGSLYLGGVSAASLAAAGRISGTRRGAVESLGRACAQDPLPWAWFNF